MTITNHICDRCGDTITNDNYCTPAEHEYRRVTGLLDAWAQTYETSERPDRQLAGRQVQAILDNVDPDHDDSATLEESEYRRITAALKEWIATGERSRSLDKKQAARMVRVILSVPA